MVRSVIEIKFVVPNQYVNDYIYDMNAQKSYSRQLLSKYHTYEELDYAINFPSYEDDMDMYDKLKMEGVI